jgi:hypothetical protein
MNTTVAPGYIQLLSVDERLLEVIHKKPHFHLLPQLKRENHSARTLQDERSQEVVIVFH